MGVCALEKDRRVCDGAEKTAKETEVTANETEVTAKEKTARKREDCAKDLWSWGK